MMSLAAISGHLEAILHPLAAILGPLGVILGFLGAMLSCLQATLVPSGLFLAPLWTILAPLKAALHRLKAPSWVCLGPSDTHLEPHWSPQASFQSNFMLHSASNDIILSSKRCSLRLLAPHGPLIIATLFDRILAFHGFVSAILSSRLWILPLAL